MMTSDVSQSSQAESSRQSSSRSATRRLMRFARKELRESLRDRRTLVTLIVMPLLVYPLLGAVVQKFALSSVPRDKPTALVIADLGSTRDQLLAIKSVDVDKWTADNSPRRRKPEADTPEEETSAASVLSAISNDMVSVTSGIELELMKDGGKGDVLDEVVRLGDADVALRVYPAWTDAKTGRRLPPTLEVISRERDPFSVRAADELEKRMIIWRDQTLRMILRRSGLDPGALTAVSRHSVVSADTGRTKLLGAFIPLVLVLMTMTGAVYPAIDLTAGERERGTLEMLMAAPVSRRMLLAGKFVAVCTIAVMTAVVNLTAMMITVYSIGFDRIVFGGAITPGVVAQIFLLLIVFASFFSAVLLSVTSVARSFREAQAYIIPLMLISLAPGILSLMPNVQFSLPLAFVPLVNIVLLGRDLFQGQANIVMFGVTIIATLAYTFLSLRIAGTVFGSDASLYGSAGGVSELWKRAAERRLSCSLPRAIACFGLIVPLFLLLSGLRSRIVDVEDMTLQLAYSGAVILLLFGLLPLLFSIWDRVDLKSGFGFFRPTPLAVIGAVCLGASLWPFAYEALMMLRSNVLTQLLGERAAELAAKITSVPLYLRLLALAAVPAICEELFFRGFLLTSLRSGGARRGPTILITAALFAAMHVVVDQALMMERFVPSFLLGVILAAMRFRTGSVVPGIVVHLVHNSLLLSLSDLTPVLEKLKLNLNDESHLPVWFLLAAGIVALGGAAMVVLSGNRTSDALSTTDSTTTE
jgi:sodium transport system permease protein